MLPTSFNESNAVLSRPDNMSADECEPLSVWRGHMILGDIPTPCVISCWKLTKDELDVVNRTGRVWLNVIGITMPPVILSGRTPFNAG